MVDITRALAIEGWMGPAELIWLAHQASKHQRIVEVGSYLGRSTRALGDHTQGTVWALDDWYGVRDSEVADRASLWTRFEHNLADLLDARRVVAVPSDHAKPPIIPADMVFIDGNHDYEDVARDIRHWRECLVPGGLLSGHDWGHAGVMRALAELLPQAQAAAQSIWAVKL